MTRITEVPSRDPVCDILCQAARLGLKFQHEKPPCSALFLYGAITDSFISCHPITKPRRNRITLKTAGIHAGEPTLPETASGSPILRESMALPIARRAHV